MSIRSSKPRAEPQCQNSKLPANKMHRPATSKNVEYDSFGGVGNARSAHNTNLYKQRRRLKRRLIGCYAEPRV